MNWKLLRDSLVNHPDAAEQPQRIARIDRGLGLLREGLEELARLGHPMHLAAGVAPAGLAWPRLVYHLQKARDGFLCSSEFDFEALGGRAGGWHDTLDEAKHSAGMDKQFTRGGVFPKRGLPALIEELEQLTPLERLKLRGMIAPDGTRY